jgi:uncharacterized damage-inducible protein DinB
MLSVTALRDYLAYSAWASGRLVDAAAQLSLEQLTRDFGTADKSVLRTLVHVFGADRLWLQRMQGASPKSYLTAADYELSVLQNDWPTLHTRWLDWAAGLTDDAAAAEHSYTDMSGKPWRQPVWQLVMHVVNHGTHHRGQVAGFIRAMGQTPPPLDFTAYCRTRLRD